MLSISSSIKNFSNRNLASLNLKNGAGTLGAGGTTLNPFRFVGTTAAGMTDQFPNDSSTLTDYTHFARMPFYIGSECTEIRFVFDNWFQNTFGVYAANNNAVDIVTIALERDGGSGGAQTVLGAFNGSSGITLAAGDSRITSDAFSPSSFSQSTFTRDQKFWWRVKVKVNGAGNKFLQGNATSAGARSYYYPTINDTVNVAATGVPLAPLGNSNDNYAYGPTAIIGRPVNVNDISVLVIGDSLTYGNGDSLGSNPPLTGLGWFSRSQVNDHNTGIDTLPGIKIALGGGRIANYCLNTKAQEYARYARVVVPFLGTNDIASDSYSLATIQANMLILMDGLANENPDYLVSMPSWPRTLSTDNWSTYENQTYDVNFSPSGMVGTWNTWLRAGADGRTNALFDPTAILSPNPLDMKWNINLHMTNETHPPDLGHIEVAFDFRTLLESLV